MANTTPRMTMDRAARRFSQIADLERQLGITEAELTEATQHVADAKNVVKALREKKSTLLIDMRVAARDEGQLPLLSLTERDE